MPSSKICSDSSFPGELKRVGLNPRISLGWPVTLQLLIWGGSKASGLPEKEMPGPGGCQEIALSLSTAAGLEKMVPGTGEREGGTASCSF